MDMFSSETSQMLVPNGCIFRKIMKINRKKNKCPKNECQTWGLFCLFFFHLMALLCFLCCEWLVKQIYLILFWAVDLKDPIEHTDVRRSEMKSNIGEEISSLFFVINFAKWSRQHSQNGVSL